MGEVGGGGEAGPVASDGVGDAGEIFLRDLVEGDGAVGDADDLSRATEALEPIGDGCGVADAAAEEEELRAVGGREGEGEFVVEAAAGVGEHLVFVDDEGAWGVAGKDALALGFEGGDEDGGTGVLGKIAGGDADVPAAALPLGPFVVGEGRVGTV